MRILIYAKYVKALISHEGKAGWVELTSSKDVHLVTSIFMLASHHLMEIKFLLKFLILNTLGMSFRWSLRLSLKD